MQTFVDLVRYRFILTNLVAKNLKTTYRNMALGVPLGRSSTRWSWSRC